MKQTPLEKRAARKARHGSGLDMNLVSLIDVFTILIFFLLSSSGVETLTGSSTTSRLVAACMPAKAREFPQMRGGSLSRHNASEIPFT